VEALKEGRERPSLKQRVKGKSNRWEHWHDRWANDVPLTESENALRVNCLEKAETRWLELFLSPATGRLCLP
jgi:hypothetical protein